MTAKRRRQRPASVGPDEVLRDSRGRVIDDAYVDSAIETAVDYARGRGRPSLSTSGESPLLRVRVSRDLEAAVKTAAEKSGESVPDWVRRTLEHASRQSG